MSFIVQVSAPHVKDTVRKDNPVEADKVFEEKIKEVRRTGGVVSLVHSSDLDNPISQLNVPEPEEEEDPEEFLCMDDMPCHPP